MPEIRPGSPEPLGATLLPGGGRVNFALFAPLAERLELCLFDQAGNETRLDMPGWSDGTWHGQVEVHAGQAYGYRAYGPWDPGVGLFFNPRKLLLDPYARAISGEGEVGPELCSWTAEELPDPRDNAHLVPRSLVVDPSFDWEGDLHPRVPWEDTLIYEAHPKGLTVLHPDLPPDLRGSYRALGSEPVIAHLKSLGVTALELLPVHARPKEPFLAERGLTNYWGYASIGFFAPHAPYGVGGDALGSVLDLKHAIKQLHKAGIEVILDVVYNHTPEGGPGHPTWCFTGLDPRYYRRRADGRLEDYTGCGNTLDLRHPFVLRLVMDSLRLWVEEYHVDGFRFDLAPALARLESAGPPIAPVWAALRQDPVLRQVKLIAEPWDLGYGGYRLGKFPRGYAEWNGEFRDTVRRFWLGDAGQLPDLGRRLTGSDDHFLERGPLGSVNYLACHDGFTLEDIVSYEHKHNHANGESNRDGHEPNYSGTWGGPEGPSDDPDVRARRARAKRAMVATLALAQGVPMLNMGDELSRSQGGNNNAYCQDNRISWLDWTGGGARDAAGRVLGTAHPVERAAFTDFVRRAFALRRAEPLLRLGVHFTGEETAAGVDLSWRRVDGAPMEEADWEDPERRCLAALACAAPLIPAIPPAERGRARDLVILLNASDHAVPFALPEGPWEVLLDSGLAAHPSGVEVVAEHYQVAPTSVVVLGAPHEGRAVGH